MRNVVIAQTSVVTSVGTDMDTTFQSFLNSRPGIIKNDRYSTKNYRSDYAALIKEIETPENRSSLLNLTDLIIKQLNDIPEDSLLLASTAQGCVDLFEKNEKNQCPINKLSLPSGIPNYIAEKLNLQDKGMNINSACASPTIAIIKGTQMIKSKRADSVLIFCADIVSEFVFSGFSSLNAISDKPTRPFDIKRDGMSLGEGGAAILLMDEELARKNSINYNTSIAGFGIASDATHITAPAPDGCGLIIAIRNALKTAKITPDNIGAINTHGTGTIYNDSMEIEALSTVFQDITIPGNSIKGSIGHTMGGAGGIEAAIGTLMLKERILPGTHGFSDPEKGAENLISKDNVSFDKEYLLSTNSGFAGTNAALVLKRINC
jgi:3-oxoacyl-[acyl-carrier-protein] synthase II|tara:strand:+ start:1253 stop:2383 length:1131 start_codon:yes stop_codon:yes gene_type:complete